MRFSINSLEFISIHSLRQLRPYRNLYNVDLKSLESKIRLNTIIIVEKSLNNILGYFSFKFSVGEKPLIASHFYETFSIQKLDLNSLEIVEFQLAEEIWDRTGLLFSLTKGLLSMMRESDCDILLVHQKEVVSDLKLFSSKIKEMPFYSEVIFCESLVIRNETVMANDKIKSSDTLKTNCKILENEVIKMDNKEINNFEDSSKYEQALSPREDVDTYLPINFLRLVERGLEIWSDPIINKETGEVSLLLGYLSNNGISQARPFTLLSIQRRDSHYASL